MDIKHTTGSITFPNSIQFNSIQLNSIQIDRMKPKQQMVMKGSTGDHDVAVSLLADANRPIQAVEDSDFCQKHSVMRRYPVFTPAEIAMGPRLGYGGFGVVFEVDELILNTDKEETLMKQPKAPAALTQGDVTPDEDTALRASCASIMSVATSVRVHSAASTDYDNDSEDREHEHHYDVSEARKIMAANVKRNGDSRYAIKCLRPDLSEVSRAHGMIDAVIEVKLLARLCHPNISTYMVVYCLCLPIDCLLLYLVPSLLSF